MDIEIRASEGGIDAEMFAVDLATAACRALTRDGINFIQDAGTIAIDGRRPKWL